MPVETQDKVDELLREDAERFRRDHPDLAEQLREYQDDWDRYQETLGREKTESPALARRDYRPA